MKKTSQRRTFSTKETGLLKTSKNGLEFFGPQMALAYWLNAISQGPINSRIPGPTPSPLALVMDMHAFKTLWTGINHRCIYSYFMCVLFLYSKFSRTINIFLNNLNVVGLNHVKIIHIPSKVLVTFCFLPAVVANDWQNYRPLLYVT